MMSLPVWLPSIMFFLGGLCAWSHAPSQGSLLGGGLCQEEGSLLEGGISVRRGVSVRRRGSGSAVGVLCQEEGVSIHGGLYQE